jgi:PPOX class probable F420-dependent enzyme
MDEKEALRRVAGARVGRLATVDGGGLPHVVPVVFALVGNTIYWAVDQKPKSSRDLKRLRNIEANPTVQLVADHYEEDWSRLWWARVTGHARTVLENEETILALEALAQKYPQYRAEPPSGPVVAIDVARVSAWESEEPRVRRPGTAPGSP